MHVFGHEHYAEDLEDLACAGVPIQHPITGKTVGAIDLTCWRKDAGSLLMALAKTTAEQHPGGAAEGQLAPGADADAGVPAKQPPARRHGSRGRRGPPADERQGPAVPRHRGSARGARARRGMLARGGSEAVVAELPTGGWAGSPAAGRRSGSRRRRDHPGQFAECRCGRADAGSVHRPPPGRFCQGWSATARPGSAAAVKSTTRTGPGSGWCSPASGASARSHSPGPPITRTTPAACSTWSTPPGRAMVSAPNWRPSWPTTQCRRW